MENQIIKLEQHPVITHVLPEYGRRVTDRLNELNIASLVATEETVKTMKDLRAELNKEAHGFEEQRKAVKDAVFAPYNEFEAVYRTEIIDKYRAADEVLKVKISDFEMKIKTERLNRLTRYFNELCEAEKIEWLTFDRLNLTVNLSTSEKKYREGILETVGNIVNDLKLIATDEYADEILVEYKKSLKVSVAIKEVRDRRQAEKIERERRLLERTRKRTSQLNSICMVYHDITGTYNLVNDESVMVELSTVETATDDGWVKMFAALESKAAAAKPATRNPAPETVRPAALQAPAVEPATPASEPVKMFTAKFQITDTYERLTALKSFLISNNYQRQNL